MNNVFPYSPQPPASYNPAASAAAVPKGPTTKGGFPGDPAAFFEKKPNNNQSQQNSNPYNDRQNNGEDGDKKKKKKKKRKNDDEGVLEGEQIEGRQHRCPSILYLQPSWLSCPGEP